MERKGGVTGTPAAMADSSFCLHLSFPVTVPSSCFSGCKIEGLVTHRHTQTKTPTNHSHANINFPCEYLSASKALQSVHMFCITTSQTNRKLNMMRVSTSRCTNFITTIHSDGHNNLHNLMTWSFNLS